MSEQQPREPQGQRPYVAEGERGGKSATTGIPRPNFVFESAHWGRSTPKRGCSCGNPTSGGARFTDLGRRRLTCALKGGDLRHVL